MIMMMVMLMMKIVGENQKERPVEIHRYSMGKWKDFWKRKVANLIFSRNSRYDMI